MASDAEFLASPRGVATDAVGWVRGVKPTGLKEERGKAELRPFLSGNKGGREGGREGVLRNLKRPFYEIFFSFH